MKYAKVVILGLLPFMSQAQMTVDAESITISASKIPAKGSEISKSVIVLTAKEIAATPVSSVDELLRYYAGINVNQRGAFGVQNDIGIRGSTFSQVLFMLDGVRLNDPLTAHFNNNIPIALSEIHHIEIIRGPGSVSFGPDAVGGIIHVKSKSYMRSADQNQRDLFVTGSLGQNAYAEGEVGLNIHHNKLGISLSARRQNSDGETLSNPNFDLGISEEETYNTFFDIQTYSGSINYHFSDSTRLFVRGGFDKRDFDAKYFYTRSAFDESKEQTDHQWYQASLQSKRKKGTRTFGIAFKNTNDFFEFNPALSANEHNTKQWIANFDYQLKVNNSVEVASGIQYIGRNITSTDRGDHDNYNMGAYSMAQGYYKDLKYTAGIRFEYFSAADEFQAVPQLSLALVKDKYILRGLVGRAYRAPDFTENYVSSQIPNLTPGRNIGNPELESEASWSIDLGIDLTPNDDVTISSTAFYRISDNLVDFTLTNSADIPNSISNILPGEDYFFATNVSQANTFGIENSVSGGYDLGGKNSMRYTANFTFLRTENDGNEVSKYLANHPDMMGNLILQFKFDQLSFTSTNSWVSRDEELVENIGAEVPGSYFISSLRANLSVGKSNFYLDARNVFDEQYQEILGAQLPGRWIIGGVNYRIQDF